MAAGLGVLGLTPQSFWAMTPRELDAALRGRLGPHLSSDAPARSDLERMMRQFPDQDDRS